MTQKSLLFFLLIARCSFCYSQNQAQIENELTQAFSKISYWATYQDSDGHTDPYDSLSQANTRFENLLLQYTSTIPQTLDFNFRDLSDSGMIIRTSEDGLFRIYSWYLHNGGTMRFYKNIFQYRNKQGTHARLSDTTAFEDAGPGCFYHGLNKFVSQNKTFYIAQSTLIGSSALTYHTVKIFSIEDYGLNDTAKLIKTKTGIRNELSYEMDFSNTANRDKVYRPEINFSTTYDPAKKVITLPLLDENGTLTARKIRYHFTGRYFEKMNPTKN